MTAKQVIAGLREGIADVLPDAQVEAVIASDGGDGFLDAIAEMLPVRKMMVPTRDPLGRSVSAPYLLDAHGSRSYIELAAASGLVLLAKDELDPLATSTYGTGMQIKHALDSGADTVFLGLGGSATNDGGAGMAMAMGYRFLDEDGIELPVNGGNLIRISKVLPPELKFAAKFVAVNDVNNPLTGADGASRVYAPQKGGSPEHVARLEAGLEHLATLVKEQLGKDVANMPGAGAAGGAGFGLKAFFDASFISGASFIFDLAALDDKLPGFDLLITGEGKIDQQTLRGKLIQELVRKARKYNIKVWAVCGISEVDPRILKEEGIDRVIEIADPEQSLDYNMDQAYSLLVNATSKHIRDLVNPGLQDYG